MTSNEGICVACYCHTIEDVIKQAHEVYSNLQSILLLQKIKPCLIDKIVDGEKLYSSDRVKNLEDFLNQGKKYLNLANGLDERNQESQMIFAIMLKALDIYSRLKIQFLSIFDENINSDEHSDEIFSDVDIGENINDPFDAVLFDDILNSINDYIVDKQLYCKIMLIKIESLIMQIQNVYITFIRNRSSLGLKLMDYCKRLRLFLSNNAAVVKLNKLERNQMQNIYCKCNLLKQLLERITEVGSRNRDTILDITK